VADVRLTLKQNDATAVAGGTAVTGVKGGLISNAEKNTLRMMLVSVCGLSLLQVLWLGEIVMTAKKEITELLS
jgi:redox-sensitive bicupin YhaK (pirin superfamily)